MNDMAVPSEAALLADALDLDETLPSIRVREPLGQGSVVSFGVPHPDDGPELLYFVDTSRLRVKAETGLLMGTPTDPDARIWLHPADPHLPALAPVVFGQAAATLLDRLGLTTTGDPVFVGYRPGRRAVVRVPTESGYVWIKVVRSSRVSRIVNAHRAFADAGVPSPAVLGWSEEGIIVLENAAGIPAPDYPWQPEGLLDEVERLQSAIRSVHLDVPVRGVATRLDWYAERAQGAVSMGSLVDEIRRSVQGIDRAETVTVHGDLHFGQLFLDDDTISGVIDVDTAGLGVAGEDHAAFIAHATASALLTASRNAPRVWALADAATRRWINPAATRGLTAIHLLGHALRASDNSEHSRADTLVRIAHGVLNGQTPSTAFGKPDL